jgi:hypothetical protein
MTFAAPLDPSKDHTATGVWFGIYDGARWSAIERVPVPDSLVPQHNSATRIVQAGDTLAWALMAQGRAHRRAVLAMRTPEGAWRIEVLPGSRAAMVDIAPGAGGPVVVTTEADTTVGYDESSVFLYTWSGRAWRRRLLMQGGDSPNFEPDVLVGRDGAVAVSSWKYAPNHERLARLWRAPAPDDSGRVSLLADSTYEIVSPREFWPVPMWVVSRQDSTDRPSELRVLVTGRDRVTVAGAIHNPYSGFFAANLDDGSNLVIAGPLQGMPPGEPIVVTQFLRAHLACDHASR